MQKFLLSSIGVVSVLLIAAAVGIGVLSSRNQVEQEGRALGMATAVTPTAIPENTPVPTLEVPLNSAVVLAQDEGLQNPTLIRKTVTVFKNKDLRTLWNLVYGSEATAPPLPIVDFTKNAVVAVLAGTQPTAGYKLSFTDIEETVDITNVQLTETTPGEGCLAASVPTSPFIMIQVPNSGKTFKTVFNTASAPCN